MHADSAKQENSVANNLDLYFTALKETGKFNGIVLAAQDGKPIFHKAFNLSSDKNSSTYVEPSSQFEIHSVSKLLAHYMIVKFEIEGKISRQQKLETFFPDFPRGDEIMIAITPVLNNL